MILDLNLLFCENQAITGDAISTNVIRLQDAGTPHGDAAPLIRNLGAGEHIPLLIQVTEDFNTLTSLEITLETSDSADLSSSTVMAASGAIPLAKLLAGFRPAFTRVLPDGENQDYLGLRFNVTGSNPTTGKITAALGTEVNT
jgi:hypothetical protein